MTRSIVFWLIWISFIAYAVLGAPPNQPDTFELISQLMTGQWAGINPWVVALFNVMGLWPLIYSSLMLTDGAGRRLWAWPFVGASFAVGAFAILPYLALRNSQPSESASSSWQLQSLNSRGFGVAIALGVLGLLGYGLLAGDWGDFIHQWQTSRFIHVMGLDFCLLCALVGPLLESDMERRGLGDRRLYWAVVLIPLFGITAYLCLRPSQQQLDTLLEVADS